MCGIPIWTCLFYLFIGALPVAPFWFGWQFWDKARKREMGWISIDSRNMYVDAAKTMITASGIAVALVASSIGSSARAADQTLVSFSARVAVVCLIACVVLSLIVILALMRGYELANSRWVRTESVAGRIASTAIPQGELTPKELVWILVPSVFALIGFIWGFLFLARIAFHF